MGKVVFYKSNRKKLCECELESDEAIVSQRKAEFEKYLDELASPNPTQKGGYKNELRLLFERLSRLKLLESNEVDSDFIYKINSSETLEEIYKAMLKAKPHADPLYLVLNNQENNEEIKELPKELQDAVSQILDEATAKPNGSASTCLRIYLDFLKDTKKCKSISDRKRVQWILEECLKVCERFYTTKNQKFSDITKPIKKYLGEFGLSFYANLQALQKGKYKGFAIHRVLSGDNYANFKAGSEGWNNAYIWIGIYENNDFELKMQDDSNDRHFKALEKMRKDGVFDKKPKYYFSETLKDFTFKNDKNMERAIDTFIELTNYLISLPKDDFLIENYQNKSTPDTPLNQILYGPPGTGKTYSTIDKALEILGIDAENMAREDKKKLFEEYREKGQIEFVTFHQSYGYEEFVEGIKPFTNEKDDSIGYKVNDGIFKTFCNQARKNLEDSKKTKEILQKEVDTSNAISDFFNENISKETLFTKTQGGKFTLKEILDEKVYIQTEDTDVNLKFPINDFEKIVLSNKDFTSSRELALEVFGEKNQSQIRTYMFQLYKEFKNENFNQSQSQIIEEVKRQNYILIIDEINRGNISKIFGELITLIEPSKRLGGSEELKVRLPYSGDEFGVPSNLYIIGTMNTADRSITSLDTALRRRFEFVEMMPNPDELSNISVFQEDKKTEIKLKEMLEKMNKRIEFLYDREKTIGHAFFLKDKEPKNLKITELKSIFQNKIIPLLQEYFYNDYAQIRAALNCNAMIKKSEEKIQDLFAMDELRNELDLEDKAIYTIADSKDTLWVNPQTYIDIYKKN